MYRVVYCTVQGHSLPLLILAACVCAATFMTAALIWPRIYSASQNMRLAWIACLGAVAGGGTWATHFIALLAYKPPVSYTFDLAPTALSLLVGILFSFLSFILMVRDRSRATAVFSALVFAAGVGSMHYVGMASIEAAAIKVWSTDLVVSSWLIGAGVTIIGFLIARNADALTERAAASTVLALSVLALHLTGMGALTLVPDPRMAHVVSGINPGDLSATIAAIVALCLFAVVALSVAEQRIAIIEARSVAKSQFLATMSHELRTPLTSIISYAELIVETAHDEGREGDVKDAQMIVDASHHLLSLISEVLDFSKLEAGELKIVPAPFSVHSVLDEAVRTAAPLVTRNNNKFEQRFADGLDSMNSDKLRLRQCLLNLLSNAAKFTNDGVITLSAEPEMRNGVDGVRFDIADTGMGIDAAKMARLFDPFTQADDSITRRFGGTGLGLAITKQLLERMGGAVSLVSEVGKGSTFTVWAPRNLDVSLGRQLARELSAEAA